MKKAADVAEVVAAVEDAEVSEEISVEIREVGHVDVADSVEVSAVAIVAAVVVTEATGAAVCVVGVAAEAAVGVEAEVETEAPMVKVAPKNPKTNSTTNKIKESRSTLKKNI